LKIKGRLHSGKKKAIEHLHRENLFLGRGADTLRKKEAIKRGEIAEEEETSKSKLPKEGEGGISCGVYPKIDHVSSRLPLARILECKERTGLKGNTASNMPEREREGGSGPYLSEQQKKRERGKIYQERKTN